MSLHDFEYMQDMGLTLFPESLGSLLEKTKIVNVDQGCPIIKRQPALFETAWVTAVSICLS